MARVEVKGRDAIAEAYRIETDAGRALVPECLMEGLRLGARPSHQEAYEWIAAHRTALARAVAALADGKTPRKPYDLLSLIDHPAPSSCPETPGVRGLTPADAVLATGPAADRS